MSKPHQHHQSAAQRSLLCLYWDIVHQPALCGCGTPVDPIFVIYDVARAQTFPQSRPQSAPPPYPCTAATVCAHDCSVGCRRWWSAHCVQQAAVAV